MAAGPDSRPWWSYLRFSVRVLIVLVLVTELRRSLPNVIINLRPQHSGVELRLSSDHHA